MRLITLIALAASLGLFACSKEGSKDKSEKTDEKKDKSWGKCEYLSLKDAKKITGHPMKNLKQEEDDITKSHSCEFETDDSDNTVVKINITVYPDKAKSVWDSCKEHSKAKIADIGDQAIEDDVGRVCVKKGDGVATVSATIVGMEKEDQQQATRKIAKRVSLEMK
jgi:hypothetical protein